MPDKILAWTDANDNEDDEDDDDGEKKGTQLLEKFRNLSNSSKLKKKEVGARYSVTDIFRNRHLTINILCLAFVW